MLRALKNVASWTGSCASMASLDSETTFTAAERSNQGNPLDHLPDCIRAIEPYQIGMSAQTLSRELGIDEHAIVKLASNENPQGMSPKARAAILEAADAAASGAAGLSRYPDEHGLRCDLAACHEIAPSQVMLGNGSDEILLNIAHTFLRPGRESVVSEFAYLSYAHATQAVGAQLVTVSARDHGHDLAAMARAITPNTGVVWIANPNNPTGTFVRERELRGFLGQVPKDVLVVLDEAYAEYLPREVYYGAHQWLNEHPNLIITRTFSKIFGMAGLRLGYGLASPGLVDALMAVRSTFSVNSIALAAARASLADTEFIDACRAENHRGVNQLVTDLQAMGLFVLPAFGNFVSFRVNDAPRVHRSLLQEGIIVRPLNQYGMDDFLRVSVGLPEQNARFTQALKRSLEQRAMTRP